MSKVLVAGYFDGMHAGHVRFFQEAAHYGRLHVAIGCDERLRRVKNQEPMLNERERLYLVQACKYVEHAFIANKVDGEGGVVWESQLAEIRPDYFIANDDTPLEWARLQREACQRHGTRYLVLRRSPPPGIEPRSSTELRKLRDRIPYRVVLSTWMDQMQLSRLAPGACIGFSIEPTREFADRSGMATSTRKTLRRLWGDRLPIGRDHVELAKIAFAAENPPRQPVDPSETFPWGSFAPRWITGSVDPITVAVPGVSRCEYHATSWPTRLETIDDEDTLAWLESVITLVATRPRPAGEAFQLSPSLKSVRALAAASEDVWTAIVNRRIGRLAAAVNDCAGHISAMSTTYLGNGVGTAVDELRREAAGCFPQGAGCGGYIACVDEHPRDRIRIRLRRPDL